MERPLVRGTLSATTNPLITLRSISEWHRTAILPVILQAAALSAKGAVSSNTGAVSSTPRSRVLAHKLTLTPGFEKLNKHLEGPPKIHGSLDVIGESTHRFAAVAREQPLVGGASRVVLERPRDPRVLKPHPRSPRRPRLLNLQVTTRA